MKILPNIAFTNKPGVTIKDLGIPDTKEHRKALEENKKAASDYFDNTIEFQTKILPYSDKSNLIAAILLTGPLLFSHPSWLHQELLTSMKTHG